MVRIEAEGVVEKKVVILSGGPGVVEAELNRLLDNYAPIVWNVQDTKDGALVTVVLLNHKEIRKSQLAMPVGVPGPYRQ